MHSPLTKSLKPLLKMTSICLIISLFGYFLSQVPGNAAEDLAAINHNQLNSLENPMIIGCLTAAKIIPFSESLKINETGVRSIGLMGVRTETVLTKVLVRFSNGKSNRLYALEGTLPKEGLKKNIFAKKGGASIKGIEITAFTPKLTGPRGKIQINIQFAKKLSTKQQQSNIAKKSVTKVNRFSPKRYHLEMRQIGAFKQIQSLTLK